MASKPTAARAALRSRFAAAIPQQREEVTVTLPDGPVTLEARGITAGDRWRIQSEGFAEKQGADGETKNSVVPRAFWPALIAATYYVPGTDERVWQAGEESEIAAMDTATVDALAAPALTLAGWGIESRAELRGNSDAEPAPAGSASA